MSDEKPKPAYSYIKTKFKFSNLKFNYSRSKVSVVIAMLVVPGYLAVKIISAELENARLKRALQEVSILEQVMADKKADAEDNSMHLH